MWEGCYSTAGRFHGWTYLKYWSELPANVRCNADMELDGCCKGKPLSELHSCDGVSRRCYIGLASCLCVWLVVSAIF
jgi:hypothetical protein